MKKRIIIANAIITVIALCVMFALGITVTKSDYNDITSDRIKELTSVYVKTYEGQEDFVSGAPKDVRVTVIAGDGKVLADSEATGLEQAENHLDREEIKAARNGNPKTVVRYSVTLGKEMMYYAETKTIGDSTYYIRVAIPVESVNSYVNKSVPLTLSIMFFAAFLSCAAGIICTSGLLKPLQTIKNGLAEIERGEYKQIPPTTGDAELNKILCDINDVSEKLKDSIKEARGERERLDYIFNNVSDGIAVINSDLTVSAANRSLKTIFGVKDASGKDINVLTADEKFISAVSETAKDKKDRLFTLSFGEKWFLVSVRSTEKDTIIAVLTEVTAEKQSEKVRLEFFANASHELKTPLTAIKGFNEMIALGVKDEKIKDYSSRIEKETDRMLVLIGDMLKLSKLENLRAPDKSEEISLKNVAEEVIQSLKPIAEERGVSLCASGDISLKGEREHFYELIKNLAENAVRYNKQGGHAEIKLFERGGKKYVEVSDDGIGIDEEHQSRIFERFYRVDKSRSRATGGTGLGLAIVKHIGELYGAEISLKSRIGFGTTFTVAFVD